MEIKNRTIDDLTTRRILCDAAIRTLITECAHDPRQPEALAHYKAQLASLDAELAEAEREYRKANGIPEPEPVVVGLKPVQLFSKTT